MEDNSKKEAYLLLKLPISPLIAAFLLGSLLQYYLQVRGVTKLAVPPICNSYCLSMSIYPWYEFREVDNIKSIKSGLLRTASFYFVLKSDSFRSISFRIQSSTPRYNALNVLHPHSRPNRRAPELASP